MDIGIGLPNPIRGTPGRLLVDWARRAEERGFTTLATIDRIAFPSYESLIALAAAGAVTERVRLFPNVLLGPTRDPVLLAKEAASVDQISNGRLVLGLGVGGRQDDFDTLGLDFSSRGKRWDEMLETMHAAWRGKPPPGTDKPVTPKPANGERIPIVIGGMSDAAVRRTLQWGEGWTAGGTPPEQVAPFAERVRKAWKDAGKAGKPRIVALSYYSIGREEESTANIKDYYAFLGDFADQLAQWVPRTGQAITETVKRFEDIGVDELILDPTVPDLEQVDRLADIVR